MHKILFTFMLTSVLLSCRPQDENGIKLPATLGDVSQVVVVGNESLWKGNVGDTIRKYFSKPYPQLPQGERYYDLRFIKESRFIEYEKRQANVFYLSIGDKEQNREARVTQAVDNFAIGQKIYTFYAINEKAFFELFEKIKVQILSDLENRTIYRGIQKHQTLKDLGLNKKILDKFGLDMTIPKGFQIASENDNTLSLKRYRDKALKIAEMGVRSHDISDGLVIYKYDHRSDSTFTLKRQMAIRDSILAQIVFSANEKPMRTERQWMPEIEELDLNGNYATKMRGLWRFDSPIMGGPFINLSLFHEVNDYAIGIDGYVFSPKFDKRDFVREVEAILHSATPVAKAITE